jgi:uncharacterized protein YbbC (DUF1343 family)
VDPSVAESPEPGSGAGLSGTRLLEATNVTEGRGTEAPFLLIGAPCLAGGADRRFPRAAGIRLGWFRIHARSSPAARDPKHADVACAGLRIHPDGAGSLSPYRFGLELIQALRDLHPEFRFLRDGAALDTLLGTRRVREGLVRSESPDRIVARDLSDLEAFRNERRPFLLY